MNRRTFLAGTVVTTTVCTSGCLGLFGDAVETEGTDDEPIDADGESLLLTADEFAAETDREWHQLAPPDDIPLRLRDADYIRQFLPGESGPEPGGQSIQTGIWYHETVDQSRETYEESPFQHGHGLEEESIAVESIAGIVEDAAVLSDEWGYVLFRDANVIGALSLAREDENDAELLSTALDLAALKHERWRK